MCNCSDIVPAVILFCSAALNSGEAILLQNSAAVHWCCITALLNEEQISIGFRV